jgi:very-short-patch-repair endonuclease
LDVEIGRIADRQRGLVTREQLLQIGLSAKEIHGRCRRGSLRVLHRGVYAVGHVALPPYARELAAVLTCGPQAFLSHDAAAALWGMQQTTSDEIDVTVVGRNPGTRAGVRIHRVTRLDRGDRSVRDGIPLTSPGRTLVDLAGVLTARQLERAFDEGRSKGVISPKALAAALERYPRRRGAALLTKLAGAKARTSKTTHTESPPEETFLAAVRRARLPPPETNVRIGRYSVDFYWRVQGVVVEIDGYRFHSTRSAFERDRAKDQELRRRGLIVLRYSRRQVEEEFEAVLVEVATTLARAA